MRCDDVCDGVVMRWYVVVVQCGTVRCDADLRNCPYSSLLCFIARNCFVFVCWTKFGGGIGADQLKWLDETLGEAESWIDSYYMCTRTFLSRFGSGQRCVMLACRDVCYEID